MSGPPYCWCEPVPCGQNPCPTRSLWFDHECDDPLCLAHHATDTDIDAALAAANDRLHKGD